MLLPINCILQLWSFQWYIHEQSRRCLIDFTSLECRDRDPCSVRSFANTALSLTVVIFQDWNYMNIRGVSILSVIECLHCYYISIKVMFPVYIRSIRLSLKCTWSLFKNIRILFPNFTHSQNLYIHDELINKYYRTLAVLHHAKRACIKIVAPDFLIQSIL